MAVHVDINPEFNDRSVMVSANDLKRNLERSGNESAEAWARGFERASPRVQKAYETAYKGASNAASTLRAEEAKLSDVRSKAEREAEALAAQETKVANVRKNLPNLTATIAAEEQKLKEIRDRHNSTLAELTVRTESATRAFTNQNSAITDLGRAFKAAESGAQSLSDSSSEMTTSIGRFGPVALAAVGGAANALSGLVGVAASASQALIALPAVVGAAGAAFGTLELATLGFDDALKALGDPKKFTDALKGLSPDAQRAALAIHSLMPEFEQLKNATQDALFANVGPQLKTLTDELLPMVQQTTTGIAQAFNAAFQGAATQLQAPETKAALDSFGQNVTRAFQELAPAVAPLTKAMGDLLSVGSGALPQIAVAATNAATAFSSFITEANNSGELKRMLDGGLNTLEQLAPVAMNFGKAFLSLAPVGEQIMPKVVDALNETAAVLPDIIKVAGGGGQVFQTWSDALKDVDPLLKVIDLSLGRIDSKLPGINQSISDLINPLHIIAEIIKGVEWFFNPGGRDNPMRDQALKGINDRRAQMGLAPMAAPDPGAPTGISPADSWSRADAAAHPNGASAGLIPGQYRKRDGSIGYATPPSLQTGSPYPGVSSGSGAPTLPAAPVTAYNSSLPAGFAGLPETPSLYSAQSSYMDANTGLAEKQARLDQLQKSNVATADQIQKARNDVITAEHTQHEAELRLYAQRDELYNKNAKQMQGYASQMGEIGVKLDQDLGISKGLAGIADNLVRFVGSLALAPWEAKMQAISNAPGQAQGGFGLMGILGAQGAFGPQYTAAGQAAASGSSGASALGPAALMPGGAYPGDAALLSNVPRGIGHYDNATKDLSKGLVDCASGVEDLVNIMDGKSTAGGSLWTGNASSVLPGMGFAPGMGGPGDFRIGYNSHHMQATLPGGTNVNYGSTPAIQAGGLDGGQGAFDPAFTDHWYRPAGAGPSPVSVGSPTTAAGMPASSSMSGLPIPLPVTIVGGGGGFGGGSPFGIPGAPGGGAPGAAPGSPAPSAAPGPTGFGDPYSPANTNPALNNPPAPAPTPGGSLGWGLPSLPSMPAGAGGQGYGPGAPGPGMAGQGAGTQIGAAVAPAGGTGKGGVGASDSTMALAGMAASALDVMAPGAGQAAQIGMKLANRAVQYGGQVAGIGVQGLMQTFLPTGGSELANNSWASKLIGGLAGAAPALPNMAGKPAAPPAQGQGQPGQPGGGGDTHNNITVNNQRATEDGTGKDVAWNMQNMYQPAGKP